MLYKHLKSIEDFESWGWLFYMHDGSIRVYPPNSYYEPGSRNGGYNRGGYREVYDANVILRWTWDYEDMWVYKNRWGGNGCWLSRLANSPNGLLTFPDDNP